MLYRPDHDPPVNRYSSKTNNYARKNNKSKTTVKRKKSEGSNNEDSMGNDNTDVRIQNLNINGLDNYELNNLELNKALQLDKRGFCQIYFSIIRREHLILFTFWPAEDYNLITIKLSLFLISLSLYFTMNGFFF